MGLVDLAHDVLKEKYTEVKKIVVDTLGLAEWKNDLVWKLCSCTKNLIAIH